MTGKPNIRIRPAQPGDMRAIRALIRHYPRQLLQNDLPRIPSFFVAEGPAGMVGCCALQIYSRRLAEVRSLAVHPDWRRQGIARQLVEACQKRAEERGIKQLLAVSSETAFFQQVGFSTFYGEKIAFFYDVPKKGVV